MIYLGKSRNIKKKINSLFTSESKIAKKIQTEVFAVTYEEIGSFLVASVKEYEELKQNKPPLNRLPKKIRFSKKFFSDQNKNMLLIDKGRTIEERSVILIENGVFKGYAFFNLNYQITNIEVLKNILVTVTEDKQHLMIAESFLQKKNSIKQIRI